MFWVFKGPKIAANFFNNILNSNFSSKNENSTQRGKGYNKLIPLEDDVNGNYGPSNLSVITSGIDDESFLVNSHSTSYVSTQGLKVVAQPSSLSSPSDQEMPLSQSLCSVTQPFLNTCSDIEMMSFESMDSTSLNQLTEEEEDDSQDSDEEDEDLTCNVCDRSYFTTRQLLSHQMRRRHYGCSTCEDIFPTWMDLESHKESSGHLSDDDLYYDDDDEENDFFEEDEEDRERLL